MNKIVHIRLDDETKNILNNLQEELNISQSDVIRMSIKMLKKHIDKVNK